MSEFQFNFKTMNAYEVHKAIINTYILKQPGDTTLLERDTSKDKRDIDVLKENHQFLWDDEPSTWEEQLAKKYYDKLFKEYCICDLIFYKENKVALRWRTEKEVVTGKGQFVCGDKKCTTADGLKTWEVNFKYVENNLKKNALVKLPGSALIKICLGLCSGCSLKLNYRVKKREIKRLAKKKSKTEKSKEAEQSSINEESSSTVTENETKVTNDTLWAQPQNVTEKSREEEFEEYLEELLF